MEVESVDKFHITVSSTCYMINKTTTKKPTNQKNPTFFGVCTCIYIKKKTKKTKQTPNKQMFDS